MRFTNTCLALGVAALVSPAALAQVTLTGTVRDFRDTHPDFEKFLGDDRGIVSATLGADGKPIYAHPLGTTATTTGKTNFDQWFHDTPGVNLSTSHAITLDPIGGGIFSYSNGAFFPIDGALFGNEGRSHNYHFTYELHSKFSYLGGESFTFSGDDDIWVFLNKGLAIDLGGVHATESATVSLDSLAASLGMSKGGVYDFDFFFAERHTSGSNFRMDTTLRLSPNAVPEPGEWAAMGILAGGLGGLILRARRPRRA